MRAQRGIPQGLEAFVFDYLSREHHLVGAALLRMGIASILLFKLLVNWDNRAFLWGPHGMYPLWLFRRDLADTQAPSLFALDSELLFNALYVGGIFIAFLYAIGWRTRLTGLAFALFTWSLFLRNPLALSGGDDLIRVTLPFLILLNTSEVLSLDSVRNSTRKRRLAQKHEFRALIHNAAVLCIILQLAIMYEASALHKLSGEMWRDGTAVGHIARVPQFYTPFLSTLLVRNAILAKALTYLTIAFEMLYPGLIWHPRTRLLVVFIAILFHLFIALFMGLLVFASTMIVYQSIVVEDIEYSGAARTLRLSLGRPSHAIHRAKANFRSFFKEV